MKTIKIFEMLDFIFLMNKKTNKKIRKCKIAKIKEERQIQPTIS